MDTPVRNLNFFSIDLHALNNLPANTFVHKDRYGHFIPTASSIAWIPGAQTLTSLAKGQTAQALANDIDDFAQQVMASMANNLSDLQLKTNALDKQQIYRQLYVLSREIKETVKTREDGGGVMGLLQTYASEKDFCEKLKQSVASLSQYAYEVMMKANDEVGKDFAEQVKICPEETFTDNEWLEAVKNSHDLRKEYTSLSKYYFNYAAALNFNVAMNFMHSSKASLGEIVGKDWDSNWNWWDEIFVHPKTEAKLYLGALPLAAGTFVSSRNDLESLKLLGVGAVISIVEVFENKSTGIVTCPIKPEEWQNADILQLQVPTPDFETMSISLILRVTAFIDWNLRNGRSCYIHCKAGRGRSKLAVDCYLIQYHKLRAQDAYNLVKIKRPQSGYDGDKWNTLMEFEKTFGYKRF